uniref:Lipoprotein n=1 Tax=Fervidobacterium nodosum TaxID=2424 RepID=A0A7C5U509_9BACT
MEKAFRTYLLWPVSVFLVVILLTLSYSCSVKPNSESPTPGVFGLKEIKSIGLENKEATATLTAKVLHVLEDGSAILSDGITAIFLDSSELKLNSKYLEKVIKIPNCSATISDNGRLNLIIKDKKITIDISKELKVNEQILSKQLNKLTKEEFPVFDGQYVKLSGEISPLLNLTEVKEYKLVDSYSNEVIIQSREYIESYNSNTPIKISIKGEVIGYLYKNHKLNRWEIIPFGQAAVKLELPKIQATVDVNIPALPPVTNLKGSFESSSKKLTLSWNYEKTNVSFFIYRKYKLDETEYYELLGKTEQSNFVLENFTLFDISEGFGVIAYQDGKESQLTLIAKEDIEVK